MAKQQHDGPLIGRVQPELKLPLIEVEGSVFEVGVQLGAIWHDTLHQAATLPLAWCVESRYRKVVERLAPHLPDLYQGLCQGADFKEGAFVPAKPTAETGGCTSFAIAPGAGLDGHPISGQSKDVSKLRGYQMQVLRVKFTDHSAHMLKLSYPGELFGHGFVAGGCSLFRNSLFVSDRVGDMPYFAFGVLAQHCPTVDQVEKLIRDFPVSTAFHTAVADEHGGILGLENGRGGPVFLKPKKGIYVHANNVVRSKRMQRYEKDGGHFRVADSQERLEHLRQRLEAEHGRITAQILYHAMADHTNFPVSICRHQNNEAISAATVIAEPTLRQMHVVRGPCCQNWPTTYRI